MAIPESQIIRQCQAGKLESFGLLYDRYIRKIYDFIYYKTHHRQTAEDLTSQTFIKALKKINQFDSAKGSFAGWLYQIARHSVIDHYRTKKAEVDIADVWDLSTNQNIARDAETADRLREIGQYLEGLSSQQREIVILRLWQQLSYAEIAELLGKTESSCKMMFSRTINQLRKSLPLASYLLLLLGL